MFESNARFRPNSANVAAKVIDGEAILINLDTGAYYSMDNVGARIWDLVDSQRQVAEIVDSITSAYAVSQETVDADVQRILAELMAENLILSSDEAPSQDAEASGTAPPADDEYKAPVLNAYHDMSALLALDPPPPLLEDLPNKNS